MRHIESSVKQQRNEWLQMFRNFLAKLHCLFLCIAARIEDLVCIIGIIIIALSICHLISYIYKF